MDTKEKKYWISNLRVTATIGVILLHVSSAITGQFGLINTADWWIGNIYESFVRFCVPVFVMLTGALLLPQEISISLFLRKRLKRVIIPFLFWSIIYVIAYTLIDYFNGEKITFTYFTNKLINGLLNGSAFHLWYVYMLIGLYLVIPILSKWIRNCTEKEIGYFLSVWFISTMILSKFESLRNITPIYYTGYIGYLVLGYYLSTKSFSDIFNVKKVSSSLFFLGVVITIAGTYLFSAKQGFFSHSFYDYLTPNVLLASSGLFLLFRHKKEGKNNILNKVISVIDKYSYGIFLTHILTLSSLSLLGISATFISPILAIPIRTFLCLAISLLLVYIVNKIPWGKYISG